MCVSLIQNSPYVIFSMNIWPNNRLCFLCVLSSVGAEVTVHKQPEDSWTQQDGILDFCLCVNGLEASIRTAHGENKHLCACLWVSK